MKVASEFWLGVTSSASHPIRLQDSLIINIWGKGFSDIVVFLHGESHQREVVSATTAFGLV